jgi:hypothetical protein
MGANKITKMMLKFQIILYNFLWTFSI